VLNYFCALCEKIPVLETGFSVKSAVLNPRVIKNTFKYLVRKYEFTSIIG